jgi:hypothetical protein
VVLDVKAGPGGEGGELISGEDLDHRRQAEEPCDVQHLPHEPGHVADADGTGD